MPELNLDVKCNYTENELVAHKAKLEDLQLRQKLMEEQNKKRKEMLAKALADRLVKIFSLTNYRLLANCSYLGLLV